MRFCIVSTQKSWGGGEVLVSSLAQCLGETGHTVSWIARKDSEVSHRLLDSGSHLLHQTRRRGQSIRDWLATRRAIQAWAPDVLIMNDAHAVPLAGSAALIGKAVRPVRLAMKHTVFPLRSRLKYQLLADKVICVSRAVRDTMIQGGMQESSAFVVYGGAVKPVQDPTANDRIRRELGLSPDARLLVAVGNLLDCKGHLDLVSAIPQVQETQTHLVIAGEGQQRESLERKIAELGLQSRVKLLGYRSDVNAIMQAADLIVHPSHAEGLSLVLIQAQMLAKPIVATAVGGAKEVLDAGSENCTTWIAKPADPSDLAQQINAALETMGDSQGRVQLQARLNASAERADHLFNIEESMRQLVNISASLIEASSKRRTEIPIHQSPSMHCLKR